MIESKEIDKATIISLIQQIFQSELSGVNRYTLYSYMIRGYRYFPLIDWFKSMAKESLDHVSRAANILRYLDMIPNFEHHQCIAKHATDFNTLITESLKHEKETLALYHELLALVDGKDVVLEEYARTQVSEELSHIQDIQFHFEIPSEGSNNA